VSEREQSRQGDNEKGWRETERVRRERERERVGERERERVCVRMLERGENGKERENEKAKLDI
jgi:hypothetical protein